MPRPKTENPKLNFPVRAKQKAAEKIVKLGGGSAQNGFDQMIEFCEKRGLFKKGK